MVLYLTPCTVQCKFMKFVLFFGIALFVVRLAVDLAQSVKGIIDGSATATESEEDRALKAEV